MSRESITTNAACETEHSIIGKVVKLAFGGAIGRAQYRGRCVGIFSIGTQGMNAEIVWFGDAVNELGSRGTFPLNELTIA